MAKDPELEQAEGFEPFGENSRPPERDDDPLDANPLDDNSLASSDSMQVAAPLSDAPDLGDLDAERSLDPAYDSPDGDSSDDGGPNGRSPNGRGADNDGPGPDLASFGGTAAEMGPPASGSLETIESNADADSLTEALDNLEDLLGTRDDAIDPSGAPGRNEAHAERQPGIIPAGNPDELTATPSPHSGALVEPLEDAARRQFLQAQYSIPLLDDVVVPGSGPTPSAEGPSAEGPQYEPTPLLGHPPNAEDDDEDDEGAADPPQPNPLATHLASRLASEVEIIVNTQAQQAMNTVIEDIKREVRKHIEIVLPEILDELAHKNADGE